MTDTLDAPLDAAQRVVDALSSDPAFVQAVAEREIARRVDAGELVPIERLRIAAGLELTPAGRLRTVEHALGLICAEIATRADALTEAGMEDLVKAAVAVAADLPAPAREETPKANGKAKPKAKTAKAAASRTRVRAQNQTETPPIAVAAETPPTPVRSGAPAYDDHPPCAKCGNVIEDEGQALLSWTRAITGVREPWCLSCFVGYEQKAS